MSLLRKYKISKILNKPLVKGDKEIVDFIEYNLNNLVLFKRGNGNDSYSTFYMNDQGKCIFEYYSENNNLYVRYTIITLLREKTINDKDISDILIYFIYKKYNLIVDVMKPLTDFWYESIEEYYSNKL